MSKMISTFWINRTLWCTLLFFAAATARAAEGNLPQSWFNLNFFDQQQGQWPDDFRAKRIKALTHFLENKNPDVVVLQEAQSEDLAGLKRSYPHQYFVGEMKGAAGEEFGYLLAARTNPTKQWSDDFYFAGGVKRKIQAAIWGSDPQKCIGVISLHWSYQSSAVRQLEARWLLAWLDRAKAECAHWLVVGDFNADEKSEELRILFRSGLKILLSSLKPTIDPINPIRQIYGKDFLPRTIDWALGFQWQAKARVVLSEPWQGEWVSDHSGLWVEQ
jgi:endonuclease/exonuclease/phosphatase family metal-dependent hydrolase